MAANVQAKWACDDCDQEYDYFNRPPRCNCGSYKIIVIYITTE